VGTKLKLGVNIDHVATLRQSRGTAYPSVLRAAEICESAGADGITIHLREDRRHIQDDDVRALRKSIKTRMNLELANTEEIVGIALEVGPDEVCMVPERRQELTTEGGLNVAAEKDAISASVERLRKADIMVSLFIAPDEEQIRASAAVGAQFVELHTGRYCELSGPEMEAELKALISGAELAKSLGLEVNAGHGINCGNLDGILRIPHMDTLNIGHSIVARAVFVGLGEAVKEMMRGMQKYDVS
jgi:pyridoxine 5-phosphate synthase